MFGQMLDFADKSRYIKPKKFKAISLETALNIQNMLPKDNQCKLEQKTIYNDSEKLLYIGEFQLPVEFTKRFKITHLPLEVTIDKSTGNIKLFVNAIRFVPYFEDEIKFAQMYFIKEQSELQKIEKSINKSLIKQMVLTNNSSF